MTNPQDQLRQLPSVDRLLRDPQVVELVQQYGREAVRDALRVVLDAAREWIRQGRKSPPTRDLLMTVAGLLQKNHTPTFRAVINATGVILHTNLGRAPLCDSAQEAIVAIASGYSTLEYQLDTGKRGYRDAHVEHLLTALTGAEAAFVVNNNASAVMLLLASLARGKQVILSRGQLVEIGGGFRMPQVMQDSGATLIEVGTTNRTTLEDFQQAITPQTALLMRVHASNFAQLGFVSQPDLSGLAQLAHRHKVLLVDDLGSGCLLDTKKFGLTHEPTVQESLRAGVDAVAFSADKLLGGPQAGIICGKAKVIAKLRSHPLARAVRIDKLCLAALVATLTHYRIGNAETALPLWRMISAPADKLKTRAETWATTLGGGDVIRADSAIGGGSLPGQLLPTYVLSLAVSDPDKVAAALRSQPAPVIARIERERLLLDPRTVLPNQDDMLLRSLHTVLSKL